MKSARVIIDLIDGDRELEDAVENEGWMTVGRIHRAVGILPNENKSSVKIQKKTFIKESTVEFVDNIMVENVLLLL